MRFLYLIVYVFMFYSLQIVLVVGTGFLIYKGTSPWLAVLTVLVMPVLQVDSKKEVESDKQD